MKNLFASMTRLAMALVAVFSLAGCGEEVSTEGLLVPSKDKVTVFSAVPAGTRTTMDSNALFYWQSMKVSGADVNDQIWIDEAGTGASFSKQSSSSEFDSDRRIGRFFFRGSLGEPAYNLSYTGFGSRTGDLVTIAEEQQQIGWDNSDHIGTSGDCATAVATRQTDGNYSFTLDHKASYLIFQPYAAASTDLNPYRVSYIEIVDTDGHALSGTFPLKMSGLDAASGTGTAARVRLSCTEANEPGGLRLPQTASKSIYAVVLPRGAADGGRALQVRYHVTTVSDGDFIVYQGISGNFEANGARLVRHDLSVPAFPTVPTYISDGNGLFGGTRFKPAFLRRTNGNATTAATLQLDTDPLVLLQYNQGAHGAAITEFQKRMFFTWNELAEIFGETTQGNGANWSTTTATAQHIDNVKAIGGKNYVLPTSGQYSKLIETPNAGRATVNYYPASFAAVKVDLSGDATYANKGWDHTRPYDSNASANYIMGYLFFPDESVILDAKIKVSSLNGRWGNTTSDLTAEELRAYTDHGCMFLPAAGYSNGSGWYNRGTIGNYWSGTIFVNIPSQASRFGFNGSGLHAVNDGRTYYFAAVLVEQP